MTKKKESRGSLGLALLAGGSKCAAGEKIRKDSAAAGCVSCLSGPPGCTWQLQGGIWRSRLLDDGVEGGIDVGHLSHFVLAMEAEAKLSCY